MQINSLIGTEKKAMTLAEVLLVLVLVGVVAAMTIPGLREYSQRTEYAQRLKKTFSTLNLAVDKALSETPGDGMNTWNLSNNLNVMNTYFKPYLNILKECAINDTACFSNSYRDLNGAAAANIASFGPSFILQDGVAIQLNECDGATCDIHVDINGPNAPNVYGFDYFEFVLNKNEQNVLPKSCAEGYCKVEDIMNKGWKIDYWE